MRNGDKVRVREAVTKDSFNRSLHSSSKVGIIDAISTGWTPKIYLVKFLTERRWMPKTSLELIIDKEKVVFT